MLITILFIAGFFIVYLIIVLIQIDISIYRRAKNIKKKGNNK